MLSRMTAGVEAATPFPWVSVKRVADASRDRADAHVTVIDVPAIWPFGIPAAGEGGHAALKRGLIRFFEPFKHLRWGDRFGRCGLSVPALTFRVSANLALANFVALSS